MAIRQKDIYKGRKNSNRAGRVIGWTIAILLVLAIVLFFVLRQFAVYDDDGNATIVLPFSAVFVQTGEY